jgi:hypothetical protein
VHRNYKGFSRKFRKTILWLKCSIKLFVLLFRKDICFESQLTSTTLANAGIPLNGPQLISSTLVINTMFLIQHYIMQWTMLLHACLISQFPCHVLCCHCRHTAVKVWTPLPGHLQTLQVTKYYSWHIAILLMSSLVTELLPKTSRSDI